MKNTVNERVTMLKTHFNLGRNQFSARANISPSTYDSIVAGKTIYPKTIQSIAEGLNVNLQWLLHGTGPMFNETSDVALAPTEKTLSAKALELFEEQLRKKDEQISSLLAFISKLDFLKLFDETSLLKKVS